MPETLKETTADKTEAVAAPVAAAPVGKPRSLWSDAWHDLRRSRCSSSRPS